MVGGPTLSSVAIMWWSSLDVSSATASATHALGPRRSPGGGHQELRSISLIGVTEDSHCPVASAALDGSTPVQQSTMTRSSTMRSAGSSPASWTPNLRRVVRKPTVHWYAVTAPGERAVARKCHTRRPRVVSLGADHLRADGSCTPLRHDLDDLRALRESGCAPPDEVCSQVQYLLCPAHPGRYAL